MTDLQIEIKEIKSTLKAMQEDIKRLEQQQQGDSAVLQGYPFGTWKEYPSSQGAPQAYIDQMTPSYHCTYEHP